MGPNWASKVSVCTFDLLGPRPCLVHAELRTCGAHINKCGTTIRFLFQIALLQWSYDLFGSGLDLHMPI